MTHKNVTNHPLNGSSSATVASATEATTHPVVAKPLVVPNPEATPKAKRRTFSVAYKRRILKEAAQCDQHGQIGALLRREGLYSSQLTEWRRQEEAGKLSHTKSKKRGRPATQTAEEKKIKKLQYENERLQKKLAQAELIIDAQKKVAALIEMISQSDSGRKS
jgi:transposase-like protein